jgi:hypothetical protein
MDKVIMDQGQLTFWIVAMIGGIITASLALINFRKSIRERQLDLRWKQADSAKEFVHEIHGNKAGVAIEMLDWFILAKPVGADSSVPGLKYDDVLAAIPKISAKAFNEQEHYILDCFDWFFYYIDRTEQHILDGLFRFDNVKFIFYPYYKKISSNRELYDTFMKDRCYYLAPNFWKRFERDPAFKNC